MENPGPHSRIASISAEAAAWFVRLKDNDLSAAEQRQYLQWLQQSPTHIAEMLRVSRVYGVLHGVGLKGLASPDLLEPNVIDWTAPKALAAAKPQPPLRHRFTWPLYSAAAAAVLVALALTWQFGPLSRSIETGPSEWRQLSLEDHTLVRMGPRTRLRMDFSDRQRQVKLESGEATFQVAQEARRPFVVHAGIAVVRALGTEFGVMYRDHQVVVTVAEGRVAVDRIGRAEIPAVPVAAGEQVSVTRSGTPVAHRVNVARELAWAEKKIFVSETVGEAVREFNRRNRIQITVTDPALAALPVRAMFDAGDPESFAAFLATAAKVRVVRPSANELIIER